MFSNRYVVQDEHGEIILEVDNFDVALRCKAYAEVVEGKRVRLIDNKTGDVLQSN